MKGRSLAALAAAAATLAAPAGASAATIAVSPVKPCYRAGETVALGGSGYTPNTNVQINSDDRVVGSTPSDAAGTFRGGLTLGLASGERVKSYSATDTSNTANTASIPLRISRVNVSVRPQNGQAGRLLTIGARGFTTGRTLYAHVVRGAHYRRNLKVGRLKGACHKLSVRRRVFSDSSRAGTYTVQFDTRRRYSTKTVVKFRFRVPVYQSAAAAQSWTRG